MLGARKSPGVGLSRKGGVRGLVGVWRLTPALFVSLGCFQHISQDASFVIAQGGECDSEAGAGGAGRSKSKDAV